MGWQGKSCHWGACWLAGMMLLAAIPPGHAAPLRVSPFPCRFESVGTGTVATVVDGRSVVLTNGREVRLAALEAPPTPLPGESGPQAAAGLAAKAALEALVAGKDVVLRQRAPVTDRYGRTVAHLFLTRDGTEQPVADALLERGFVRVSGDVGDPACAAELLSRERVARDGKLGLWGEPYYVIIGAGSGAELLADRGRFTVAEGKVLSVRESGGTIFVNFGRRWSQALTVTVLKRRERIFTGAGIDLRNLASRQVRVRGWVEERNGPRIEATRPEQIEIAERN